MLRTHTCGELNKKQKGKSVTLCGWVHARRDHGGIIFIDLRDHYGLTQIKFDPNISAQAHKIADQARSEWVLKVSGEVIERPANMINPKMATGEVEIAVTEIEILNQSKTPPFEIGDSSVGEELRLTYRYLDLRSAHLQKIMKDRDNLITYIREYFHKYDFTEVQTPILANSSPEGARDYLVPSRIHPGKFFALPQAPQQFKQLLMVAGLDRYFQIAPCFRDEDPRADRHPGDFYQLDVEMSFVAQVDVWALIEPLMVELTERFSDKECTPAPFPRIPYDEAISRYGSDKPDLRFDLPIVNVSEIFKNSGFKVFTEALKIKNGIINALCVKGGAKFTRSQIDELTEIAKGRGAKGLAYIVYEKELKSPILKFMSPEEITSVTKATGAKEGDIVFFGADEWKTASKALGVVRSECGARLGLKDPKKASWVWIIDFPMFSVNDEGKLDFEHNPFSMMHGGMEALETKNPLEIKAMQYDLVCNGFEISSGAIRNHRTDIMYKAFSLVGYTNEQVNEKFGHMIKAFEYGAPPHGGCAPGLDRLMMVFWELPSLRDLIAFPKSGNGLDLMLGAPSEVEAKQLKELHLKVEKIDKKK